jgi:drug/metabolite transporter (DMT)-like permease
MLSSTYMFTAGTPSFPWGAKDVRPLLWMRGICGFLGIYSFYCTFSPLISYLHPDNPDSLRFLPLAEGVIIGFLAPLLTAYTTSLLLKTPLSNRQMLAGMIAFLGVAVIADPFSIHSSLKLHFQRKSSNGNPSQYTSASIPTVSPSNRITAIVLGLFSVLATTGAFTTIRLIGDRAHALVQVNYYSLVTTIISGLILFLPLPPLPFLGNTNFRLPATSREWTLLAYVGICGFMLQFLMTAGLQAEKGSRATNMMYSQILFALCLDWGIWGQVPGWGSAVGGAVVLGAVIWGSVSNDRVTFESQRGYGYIAVCTNDDIEMSD